MREITTMMMMRKGKVVWRIFVVFLFALSLALDTRNCIDQKRASKLRNKSIIDCIVW